MNPQIAWQAGMVETAFTQMYPVLAGRRRLRDIERVVDDLHQRATDIQTGLLDRVRQSGRSGPDCVPGCDHCCYVRVHTTVVEAVRIATYLLESNTPTELEEISEQLEAFCTAVNQLSGPEYFETRLACPFLTQQLCSVYAVRPIPCQSYMSWSVKACYDHFVLNLPSEIPKLDAMGQAMGPLSAGLSRAVVEAGAGPAWVSLPHAVRAALSPGALREWQAGQDLFGSSEAPLLPDMPKTN